MNIAEICKEFNIDMVEKQDITTGLINSTSLITDKNGQKYILQEINANVFKDVDGLMKNIQLVTDHIKGKVINNEGDVRREVLNPIKANGRLYVQVGGGENVRYFRMYNNIEDASTYNEASEDMMRKAGIGFGRFQKQLADFPATKLKESIPEFHNTTKRLATFINS